MDTKLTIKNFRVFDEDGVSIDLKPITILTGCNSSGKSSLTKAVSLLNLFLKQIKKDVDNRESINLEKYRLDFTTYPNSLLGNFNRVVHKGSSNREVTFEYTVYSRMLTTDITVQLVFTNNGNDQLNNGWLKRMSLSTSEGQFFSTDKENGSICNINLIKDAGIDFMIAEYLVDCYCGLVGAYDCEHSITKEEFETQKSIIESELNKCGEDYKKDVCAYIRKSSNRNSIIARRKVNPAIVLWSKENGSIFMIPIIEELNKLDKSDVKKWISKIDFTKTPKGLESYTNIIFDDFIASKYTCFRDYFNHYETLFLGRYKFHKLFNSNYLDFSEFARSTNFESLKDIKFEYLYECVMLLNEQVFEQKNDYYELSDEKNRYHHFMMNHLFNTFLNDLLIEVLTPEWSDNMEYASSSRAKIQRLYTLEADDDFTRLLKNYFVQKREFENETNSRHKDSEYKPDSFLNKWISKIGIGSEIELSTDAFEGLGVTIKLHKTENDKKGHMLADEGYGITQLFTVLLQIETAILSARGERDNGYYGLDDLDRQQTIEEFLYGFNYEVNTILIEEPEIHLHPKYQSMLADMMVDAYKNYNIHFIVETHSEYLIRKLQVLVAEGKVDMKKISLNYFDNPNIEKRGSHTPQVKAIDILPDGRLSDKFGEGFFDEADKRAMDLLRIKACQK